MKPSSYRIGRTVLALVVPALLFGCGPKSSSGPPGTITAVGAENEYANVITQIGGKYVHAIAVLSNPNTDPHTFEAGPGVAEELSNAKLLVQNGVGYDDFMEKIESNSSTTGRQIINVQKLLGLPDNTPNPHLWYKPVTMPAVATAIKKALTTLQPDHAQYFQRRLATFQRSLNPWRAAIAHLKATYAGTPVATTEPVSDYLLQAAGLKNMTPFKFQADIMNGVDLPPQYVTLQDNLFTQHQVKAFVYNRQVVSSTTRAFLSLARQNHIPVVGVYETMPTPGYTYQSWMLAETKGLQNAFEHGTSAPRL